MANATQFPSSTQLTWFQWSTPTAPNPRLAAPVTATATTLTFTSPPRDSSGTIITGGFLMGAKDNNGYTETIYVPAGAMSGDGLTATGVVRGIRLAGIDYTTAGTSLAVALPQDAPVFCNVSAVNFAMMVAAMQGSIGSGGTGWKVGDGTDSNIRVTAYNSDSNKPYWEYNAATNQWVFSNDGVSSTPFGTGAGVTGGDGITVTAGDIDIDLTDTTIFKQTSAGTSDSGKVPRLTSAGVLDSSFLPVGTGADGAINVTSGTTTTNPTYGVLNYTSINVSAGATWKFGANFQNKVVYIRVTGDVTIAGTLDLDGLGGAGGDGGAGGSGGGNGSDGVDGTISTDILASTTQQGTKGLGGVATATGTGGAGGNGGTEGLIVPVQYLYITPKKGFFAVTPGSGAGGGAGGGAEGVGGTQGTAGVGGSTSATPTAGGAATGAANASPGGGGGGGGAGGGALVMLIGGNLTISGTIRARGQGGANGGNSAVATSGSSGGGGGGGAGGGGAGGSFLILYRGTFTDTGTYQVTGGTSGTGGTGANGLGAAYAAGGGGGGGGANGGAGGNAGTLGGAGGGGGGATAGGFNAAGAAGTTGTGGGGGGGAGGGGGTGGAAGNGTYLIEKMFL